MGPTNENGDTQLHRVSPFSFVCLVSARTHPWWALAAGPGALRSSVTAVPVGIEPHGARVRGRPAAEGAPATRPTQRDPPRV